MSLANSKLFKPPARPLSLTLGHCVTTIVIALHVQILSNYIRFRFSTELKPDTIPTSTNLLHDLLLQVLVLTELLHVDGEALFLGPGGGRQLVRNYDSHQVALQTVPVDQDLGSGSLS